MRMFEWTLLLLAGAIAFSGFARRLRVPWPSFLALFGVALAFIPATPHLSLDPELALALFVAPVLLDAAFDTSVRDLKENWRPITGLVVAAVLITTAAVAIIAHWLAPGLNWASAIALGAIVAPPDAAAATAVLRQVRLPHRLLVILEGEGLLNDATSLLIYRAAVAAAISGTFNFAWQTAKFPLVILGSIALGWLLARTVFLVSRRITEVTSAIVTQFLSTFAVWLLADYIGLSAILTVVVYGIVVARRAPMETPARLRVPSYAVWEVVVFILNVLAFMLIGLQLKPIMSRLSPDQRWHYLGISAVILLTTIIARFAWVMTVGEAVRWKVRRFGARNGKPFMPDRPTGILVSWCGMRGIVTLAAALALPDGSHGTHACPFRDLIILCAFVVTVGTLVLQGFTLRPLLRILNLKDDEPVSREVSAARTKTLHAAFDSIVSDRSSEAEFLRKEYEDLLHRAEADPEGSTVIRPAVDGLRRKAVAAGRRALDEMRTTGEIGDDAYHLIEGRLDIMELNAGGREGDEV